MTRALVIHKNAFPLFAPSGPKGGAFRIFPELSNYGESPGRAGGLPRLIKLSYQAINIGAGAVLLSQNYKRIAKNTLFLYFRMIIIMAVSLYTTRIILATLGVTDFGIYHVVASFVILFGFLNSALSSSTQRFITFELGKVGEQELKKVFSISIIIHIALAFLVFVLSQTIGLWFLNSQMNIPPERTGAAFWVFQFSVLSTMIGIFKVPYHAMVIAHEHMSFFAYMSILEAVLKLLAVYLLVIVAYDKLVAYSAFVFCTILMIFGFYYLYNKRHYSFARFSILWDRTLAKEMFSFSGWSLFGGIAWMLMNHGVNIILNIFFGPSVNAAKGLSMQVNTAIKSLISSFRMAVNPQIIKMYGAENNNGMKHLSLLSARYTFYLALILILPLYLEIETVLNLWLLEVPEWAIEFCQLTLIMTLIQTFDLSFAVIFQAMGDIKQNQILTGMTYMFVLPIGYVLIAFYNMAPTSVLYVQIVATIIVSFFVKIYLLRKIAKISILHLLSSFFLPVSRVLVCVFIFSYLLYSLNQGFIVTIFSSILIVVTAVFCLDIDRRMRNHLVFLLKNKIHR
jgi:O-antigen/teichoic acid export membrane protein